jgi:hypothetical protein
LSDIQFANVVKQEVDLTATAAKVYDSINIDVYEMQQNITSIAASANAIQTASKELDRGKELINTSTQEDDDDEDEEEESLSPAQRKAYADMEKYRERLSDSNAVKKIIAQPLTVDEEINLIIDESNKQLKVSTRSKTKAKPQPL